MTKTTTARERTKDGKAERWGRAAARSAAAAGEAAPKQWPGRFRSRVRTAGAPQRGDADGSFVRCTRSSAAAATLSGSCIPGERPGSVAAEVCSSGDRAADVRRPDNWRLEPMTLREALQMSGVYGRMVKPWKPDGGEG